MIKRRKKSLNYGYIENTTTFYIKSAYKNSPQELLEIFLHFLDQVNVLIFSGIIDSLSS